MSTAEWILVGVAVWLVIGLLLGFGIGLIGKILRNLDP
jgi:hypothetical protein